METLIDNFGRIVIPKKVRDHFALRPGTHVRIEETDDTIILKPYFGEPNLVDKDGVLVYTGTSTENIEQSLTRHRKKRITDLGD